MKKEIYELVYSNGESYKYDVKKDEDNVYIHASKSDSSWTKPGTLFAKLNNHGNGFTIEFQDNKIVELDYCQAEELRILLHAENSDSPTKVNKYKKIK